MYTVCTFRISTILKASFLDSIPQVFIYLALVAWLITFLAMIRIIVKRYTNDFKKSGLATKNDNQLSGNNMFI